MKLIVEKTRDAVKRPDGRRPFSIHVYVESNDHFREVERRRDTKRLPASTLETECDVEKLPGEWHMVFDLADPKAKRRTRR